MMAGTDLDSCKAFARGLPNPVVSYRDVLLPLKDKDEDYVCAVLKEALSLGVEWSEEPWQHGEEVELFPTMGAQVLRHCLDIPHIIDHVLRKRPASLMDSLGGLRWDTAPHALAHLGRADLLQVLVDVFPDDQQIKVRGQFTQFKSVAGNVTKFFSTDPCVVLKHDWPFFFAES